MKPPCYIGEAKWKKEREHSELWLALTAQETVLFNYLYGRLSILDDKVAALLTFNSILLAAASLAWTKIVELPGVKLIFLHGAALAWLISTIICLCISFLKWEHLCPRERIDHDYRDKIIEVTIRRTRAYNFALAFIFVALMIFVSVWVWLSISKPQPDMHPSLVSLY